MIYLLFDLQKNKRKINNYTTSTRTKSASTNAVMNKSVHVCSSWMMNKALSAHGCAVSADTSKTLK